MNREEQIKDAEINYSGIYNVSEVVFTKKASEILNIPITRVEVRRNIMAGSSFGKLHIIVYDENDTEQQYYHLSNKAVHYHNMPQNIYDFENELIKKIHNN